MVNLLSVTVTLPLLGAAGLLLVSYLLAERDVERGRLWMSGIAVGLAATAFVLVLFLRAGGPATAGLSAPRPGLLSESGVRLHCDPALWPLAVGLSAAVCSLLAARLGRQSDSSVRHSLLCLVFLSVGLAALWSGNPLTTIVSWALCDLFLLLGQIVSGAGRRESARSWALGTASALFVWAGVLVAGDGTGNVQWSLMPPGGLKMTMWMVAGLLRVGAYPLHLSTPRRVDVWPSLGATLSLSPVLGWGLWTRLALVNDGMLPLQPWVTVLATLTVAVGGFLAWTASSARAARPWIVMGTSGTVLLSSVLASLSGQGQGSRDPLVLAVLVLGVTGWMLGTTLLFLGGRLGWPPDVSREALPRTIPSLLGALSLLGAPLTLGFVAVSALMRDLTELERWGWTVGFVVGQTFLVGALARWLFSSAPDETGRDSVLARGGEAAGLVVPALFLVVAGLIPNVLFAGSTGPSLPHLLALPGLTGWILWIAPVLLGGVLAWQSVRLRPRISLWLKALHDAVRLDWVYELLAGALEQGLTIVRTVDDVLGGKGALLWSVVVVLILVLTWRAG